MNLVLRVFKSKVAYMSNKARVHPNHSISHLTTHYYQRTQKKKQSTLLVIVKHKVCCKLWFSAQILSRYNWDAKWSKKKKLWYNLWHEKYKKKQSLFAIHCKTWTLCWYLWASMKFVQLQNDVKKLAQHYVKKN
jgi:hypothetical protein